MSRALSYWFYSRLARFSPRVHHGDMSYCQPISLGGCHNMPGKLEDAVWHPGEHFGVRPDMAPQKWAALRIGAFGMDQVPVDEIQLCQVLQEARLEWKQWHLCVCVSRCKMFPSYPPLGSNSISTDLCQSTQHLRNEHFKCKRWNLGGKHGSTFTVCILGHPLRTTYVYIYIYIFYWIDIHMMMFS